MWSYLFVRRFVVLSCLLLLSLAACAPDRETVVPLTRRAAEASPLPTTATMAPLAEPSPTVVTATIAATVAATATPIATSTPTAAAASETIAPTGAPATAPENAEEVTQLARLGKGRIDGVSWSPDGKLIAVSGYHGIDLYDAPTLQLIYTIDAQGPYGSTLSFSPQGDAFVLFSSGDYEPSVSLWDTVSGQHLRDLDTYTMPVFTPDGEAIIFSPGAPQLVRQDVRTGEETLLIEEVHRFSSTPIDYPPDLASQTFALSNYNDEDGTETLYLYDMVTGQRRHTLEALVDVERIVFSPKGDLLVKLRQDDSTALRLYDPASGQLRYTLDMPDYVGATVFSPQGELLATGSGDGIVRVWDVSGGELLYELEGHTSWLLDLVFSPDGRVLATNSNETVRLWDTATGQLLHQLTRPLRPVGWSWSPFAFSPDGREVAAVSGSRVLFFDVTSGALQRSLDGYYFASDVVFSPDSNALITVGGHDVRTLDVHSGELLELRQSDEPVGSVALSPGGRLMAWGGAEEQYWLQVWDRTADQLLYTIEEEAEPVNEVTFSPDGQLLATRSGYWPASVVQVREASSSRLLFSHEAGRFVFSPDGRLFATSSAEWPEKATTELWEVPAFQLARRFEQFELLAFGPAGNVLARRGVENRVGFLEVTTGWWDLNGDELLQSFGSESSLSRPIALSPDGRLLLGDVGVFNIQDIWDLNTGRTLGSINDGSTAAFSPDGRLLATVGRDGVVSLWGLPDTFHGE